MPRSSTTRKGNGPGWGGEAKGSGSGQVATPETAEKGRRIARAQGVTAAMRYAALTDRQRAEAMREVLFDVALDEEHAHRVIAADKLLDRIEGKALARTQLTGAAGGPLRMDFSGMTDAELAAAAAELESGAAGEPDEDGA